MSPATKALNKALAAAGAGDRKGAKDAAVRAIQLAGQEPATWYQGVRVLMELGEVPTAEYWASGLTKAYPKQVGVHELLAATQALQNRLDEAIRSLETELSVSYAQPEPLHHLTWLYTQEHRYRDIIDVVAKAAAVGVDNALMFFRRTSALLALGRTEEALRIFREGAARYGGTADYFGQLANASNSLESLSAEEVFDAHRRYGAALAAAQPAREPPPRRTIGPGDCIRVGVISPDLRRHAVTYFAHALLTRVDRSAVELFVYFTHPNPDARSAEYRELVGHDHWRHLSVDDLDACERVVRNDRLDLMIELSGLTRGQALPLLARRPSPVQASYIGYPNTTGLSAIDFRIVDSLTDLEPFSDRLNVERLVRLDPCFLCYTPPAGDGTPPLAWTSPESTGRPLVFGSLNNLSKINGRVLEVWARVLKGVPGSRLVFKHWALKAQQVRDDLLERCRASGMDPTRIDFVEPPKDYRAHLDCYNQVDIALDTFPYNGTTTTAESFLMGVPVVALQGRTHVERVSESFLRNVGLSELLAPDPEAYARFAIELARDPARLAKLRTTTRERFLASPICDGEAYGRRMTAALRWMVQGGPGSFSPPGSGR